MNINLDHISVELHSCFKQGVILPKPLALEVINSHNFTHTSTKLEERDYKCICGMSLTIYPELQIADLFQHMSLDICENGHCPLSEEEHLTADIIG